MHDSGERGTRLDVSARQVLRDLPLRRAPATLEARVLGELRRRAAAPWWHRGFAQWSWSTRTAFAALCSVVMAVSVWGTVWPQHVVLLTPQASSGFSLQLPAVQPAFAAMAAARDLALLLARLVPNLWVEWGFGLGALLYMILFGLGAAGYRALYLQPENGR